MGWLLLVVELTRDDLAPMLPAPDLEPVVHYLAGALVELMVWWLDSRSPLPREVIEALFHRLSRAALSSARTE